MSYARRSGSECVYLQGIFRLDLRPQSLLPYELQIYTSVWRLSVAISHLKFRVHFLFISSLVRTVNCLWTAIRVQRQENG